MTPRRRAPAWPPPPARRVRARARAPARRLRRAGHGAPRRPARRARPDGPLAVDQRPQPRRRLPAPARAASLLGGRPRRARRGGRGGDPARRPARPEVAPHPGDPARAAATTSTSRWLRDAPLAEARDAPDRAARRRAQDGGVRAAVRLRPPRRARRHARLPRRHAARPAAAAARRSDELHDAMLALTPPGAELELHVNLLRHGRRTCHARSPACAAARCGGCARAARRDRPVTTTWLELDGPAALRPSRPPRVPGVVIACVRPPDGALNRRLYAAVGAAHAGRPAPRGRGVVAGPCRGRRDVAATVAGADAGYASSSPGPTWARRRAAGGGRGRLFRACPGFQGGASAGLPLTRVCLRRGLQLARRGSGCTPAPSTARSRCRTTSRVTSS